MTDRLAADSGLVELRPARHLSWPRWSFDDARAPATAHQPSWDTTERCENACFRSLWAVLGCYFCQSLAIALQSTPDRALEGALGQRFLSEARATARCKHDNIVDIYDVGEADDRAYMVLEYIEGITLRAWLRDRWDDSGGPSAGTEPGQLHYRAELLGDH